MTADYDEIAALRERYKAQAEEITRLKEIVREIESCAQINGFSEVLKMAQIGLGKMPQGSLKAHELQKPL